MAHLWVARPQDCPREVDWLDAAELERYERYSVDSARERFVLSHCFVRQVLTRHVPRLAEPDWHFDLGQRGRPEIAATLQESMPETLGLRFNLSHADGLFALVVTRNYDCGVDVESIDRSTDLVGVGKRSFASPEFALFSALSGAEQRRQFFVYWTLKESYIKAIGTGLATPLRDFWFDTTGLEIAISFAPQLDDVPERWQFGLHSPTAQHQLAWAIGANTQGAFPTVQFHRFTKDVGSNPGPRLPL